MTNTNTQSSPSAAFGLMSLVGFGLGVCSLLLAFTSARDGGEGLGLDRVQQFLIFGSVVFALGLTSAGVGLFRSERPQWLAGLGALLCTVPLVLCILGLAMFYRLHQH